MTARSQARRRKGAHKRYSQGGIHRDSNAGEALWGLSGEMLDSWPTGEPLFVYFISEHTDEPDRPIKIGQAADPLKRLQTLQCGNSRPLKVEALILATDSLESALHRTFRGAHVRGEWFGLGLQPIIRQVADAIATEQIAQHHAGKDAGWIARYAHFMLAEMGLQHGNDVIRGVQVTATDLRRALDIAR